MIMLDTHVAVSLYEGRTGGLSTRAKRELERGMVRISPAIMLELEILNEIGRVRPRAVAIAASLQEQLGVRIATEPFADIVAEALGLAFTRDPFDRLIVAHAALLKAPLITFDEQLRRHYPRAMN